jgi:Acyclic terpene utilisation family protein AtuA
MVGYPIVEAQADGGFAITKHAGTGGLVSVDTVRHQLVYEMGDPHRYLTPDVIADFGSVTLEQEGPERVRVRGARGSAPTGTYKVSLSYQDGWKTVGQLTISGPDALAKAQLCSDVVWKRLAYDGCTFRPEEKLVEFVGAGVCHAGIAGGENADAPEVVLRLGVKGPDRAKVERFGFELVPLVTSGPPGVTGFAGGRPKAGEIIGFWPALLSKSRVSTRVSIHD